MESATPAESLVCAAGERQKQRVKIFPGSNTAPTYCPAGRPLPDAVGFCKDRAWARHWSQERAPASAGQLRWNWPGAATTGPGRAALEPLEDVSEKIRGEAAAVSIIPADVALADQRHKSAKTTRDELGGLDLLVNNAAVLAAGPLNHLGSEELEQAIATNLTAAAGSDAVVHARAEPVASGCVVLVASGAAYLPLPYMSAYCATKAGLRAAGEVLRFELHPLGVRLLVAYPPFTATPMTERLCHPREIPVRVAEPETIGRHNHPGGFGRPERVLLCLERLGIGQGRAVCAACGQGGFAVASAAIRTPGRSRARCGNR